jgi:hypothetical protein
MFGDAKLLKSGPQKWRLEVLSTGLWREEGESRQEATGKVGKWGRRENCTGHNTLMPRDLSKRDEDAESTGLCAVVEQRLELLLN